MESITITVKPDYSDISDPVFMAIARTDDGDLASITVHCHGRPPLESYLERCTELGLASVHGIEMDLAYDVWMPGEPKPRESYGSDIQYIRACHEYGPPQVTNHRARES